MHPRESDKLRLLFIGEGLVLAGAIEIAQTRGHQITGVFCTAAPEASAMARAGLPVSGPVGTVAEFVAANSCDVVFSIANGRILDIDTLARPRLAAVNYHNAPLPAYAGRWATAWAILNGEPEHGITWHLMAPGIDTGPILVQRRFALAPTETTGTLNLRCTEAALGSFEEVLGKLKDGDISGQSQDFTQRSYFGRSNTAPNGGVIDWNWPVAKILRFVRACDWGSSANAFGEAKIVLPGGCTHGVRSAAATTGTGLPGVILEKEGTSLTVACTDGAVRFRLDRAPNLQSVISLTVTHDFDAVHRAAKVEALTYPTVLQPILGSIMANAAVGPHLPAILGDQIHITREDLVLRARCFATTLLAHGMRREDGVGLLLPMGYDFLAAALGAMLAGGAYVPLNPSSPPARLAFEIAEAGITHVIGELVDSVSPLNITGLVFIDAGNIAAAGSAVLPEISPKQCAYRIFTSGSTGRPKAVEISHGALANLVAHYHDALLMSHDDRMTALAHPTFDASVGDIWPILTAGGILLLPPNDILLDPAGLIKWLCDVSASYSFVPTAVAELLLGLHWPAEMELKGLLTGGSALHHRPPPELPFRVINTYGPTENTVDSLWGDVGPTGGRPSIGKPIRGVTAKVLGEDGKSVLPGETGELALGGAQLALGYRGRPELTAERFQISDGERWYRTGDLVRMDLHGDYEFHGRMDDQVQVMGIRVEPGEIEALLKSDTRVADAICLPLRMGEHVTGLAAHVSPRSGEVSGMLAADLRRLLQQQLPVALVPRTLRLHDTLPYNSAGKVDRKALSDADAALTPDANATHETDHLRAIWLACVPGSAGANEDQSFWDLGGDSLAAIVLLMRLEKEAGIHMPVGAFLTSPSLSGIRRHQAMSDAVRSSANNDELPCNLISLQPEGDSHPLYIIHGLSGNILAFRHLAQALSPHRPVYGVEAFPLDKECPNGHSVTAIATRYADQIIARTPRGPIYLLGFSLGGWYAYATAAALLERGADVGFLGILDTYELGPVIDKWVSLHVLAFKLRTKLFNMPRILLERAERYIVRKLKNSPKSGVDPFEELMGHYRPQPLPIMVNLFSTPATIARITPLWRHYARGGLQIHLILDNHEDFIHADHAHHLAATIDKVLISIEVERP